MTDPADNDPGCPPQRPAVTASTTGRRRSGFRRAATAQVWGWRAMVATAALAGAALLLQLALPDLAEWVWLALYGASRTVAICPPTKARRSRYDPTAPVRAADGG